MSNLDITDVDVDNLNELAEFLAPRDDGYSFFFYLLIVYIFVFFVLFYRKYYSF
jgi:hypothetical protein